MESTDEIPLNAASMPRRDGSTGLLAERQACNRQAARPAVSSPRFSPPLERFSKGEQRASILEFASPQALPSCDSNSTCPAIAKPRQANSASEYVRRLVPGSSKSSSHKSSRATSVADDERSITQRGPDSISGEKRRGRFFSRASLSTAE